VSAELVCVGLSHKTAPLSVREKLVLSEAQAQAILQRIARDPKEAMLVSTCNRVELYVVGPSGEEASLGARSELEAISGPEASGHFYQLGGDAALVHLFRVVASLDSMVVGEPQILGQVKDAFELAQKEGAARGELARVCSAAFSSAKRVRSETGVGRAATSMASAAVSLATKVFGGLAQRAVLLVGAGEMAEVAGRHVLAAGAASITVTNRTPERAQALAETLKGRAVPFEALHSELVPADLVICSTASPHPLITRAQVAAVLRQRKHRPLFMVDLAVPRDIAPDVNTLDEVYAYDVDDIQKVVAENTAARSAEAAKAEVLVAEEVAKFVRSRAIREGAPVLRQLRSRGEQIARAEVERSLAAWGAALSAEQRTGLEAMALAIVNKLLHLPTAKLRQLAAEEGGNRLVGAAAELFGLEEPENSQTGRDNG
jgi:glutamyl-tRNA reductase